MTAILPKELLTATLGGLSLLIVSGGSDGDVLVQQSDGTYAPETLVTGDVFGPASSTDNAIARFDATTGKLLQNCVVTIGDTGNIAGLGTVSCGVITASGSVTASYFYGGIRSATAFTSNWATVYQIRVHPSAYIGWDSVSEVGNDVDIQLNRKSLGKLAVRGDNGLCVRNLADSADAALTCGAITASKLGVTTTTGGSSCQIYDSAGSQTSGLQIDGTTTAIWRNNSLAFSTSSAGPCFWNGNGLRFASGGVTPLVFLRSGGTDVLAIRNNADSTDAALTCGAITASGAIASSSGTSSVSSIDVSGQVRITGGVAHVRLANGSSATGALQIYRNDASTPGDLLCGAITATGLVSMGIYTVATLPSASANAYKEANVSDALTPAMGVAVAGGGSVKTKVRSNGTDWTVCGI